MCVSVCPNLNALFRLVVPIVRLVSLWPPYLCPLSVGYLFVTLRQPAKNALFAVDINFGFTFTRRSIIVFCFSHSFIIIFFRNLTLPQEEERTRFGHSQCSVAQSQLAAPSLFTNFCAAFCFVTVVCLLFLALRDFTLSVQAR